MEHRFMTDEEFAKHEVDALAVVTGSWLEKLANAIEYLRQLGATVEPVGKGRFAVSVPQRFNVLEYEPLELIGFARKCGFEQ